MIRLSNYIYNSLFFEGKVDGLKNVKTIRHYTTGAALKSILKNGYIEARESHGDEDWAAYDLHDKKVVSFHDARTDPEWEEFVENNKRKISMEGYTPTLGLHEKKVCACIEIDYDKLDSLIQDNTHLLNIYGKKAEEFCNSWNYFIGTITKDQNALVAFYSCKYDFAEFIKNAIEANDTELLNSLQFIWQNKFKVHDIVKKPEARLAMDEIRKVFLGHYPEKDLYASVENRLGDTVEMIYNQINEYMGDDFGYGFPTTQQIEMLLEKLKTEIKFYKRTTFKIFNDDEIKRLANYAVKFDVVSIIKMMRNHGWRPGDENIGSLIYGGRQFNAVTKKYQDNTLLHWIEKLMGNKERTINADIEIRIGSNVYINKDNCKIIIFDGICEATKQTSLLSLPKKYYDRYNIEHVKPS